jgi:DNA-binding response OmpR family regulator
MSGWEVYQQIQAQPDLRKIPLVIMSGRKEEVTEKLSEPFEYFEFLNKPFDKKQLIDAIKLAMAKAKLPRPEPVLAGAGAVAAKNGVATAENNTVVAPVSVENTKATTTSEVGETASAAEIKALNEKIVTMQAEIEGLKKQLAQVVTFIKQKIK